MFTDLAISQGDCFGRHGLDEARVDVCEGVRIWSTMQGRQGLARRSTVVAGDKSIVTVHAPAIAKYKRRSICSQTGVCVSGITQSELEATISNYPPKSNRYEIGALPL